jgi:hypothetical protein
MSICTNNYILVPTRDKYILSEKKSSMTHICLQIYHYKPLPIIRNLIDHNYAGWIIFEYDKNSGNVKS